MIQEGLSRDTKTQPWLHLHVSITDVRVLIDSKAQLTLLGTQMDFVENELSSEFVFLNPNIKGVCGCGESFNV